MLIKELIINNEGINKQNDRIDEIKEEYKDDEYIQSLEYVKTLSDEFCEYNEWTNELTKENDIKLVDDTVDIQGVYITYLNYDDMLEEITMHKIVEADYNSKSYWMNYGVCDNASQVIEYYKNLVDESIFDSNKTHVIMLVPMFKSAQSESGGWRWHKWGEYIGVQNPQHEYLYDEEDIDLVYAFDIKEITIQ